MRTNSGKVLEVNLIDMPGFNDNNRNDDIFLTEIEDMLSRRGAEANCKLSGVIYMHDICNPFMYGPAKYRLKMFRRLFRETESAKMENVLLATNRWDLAGRKEGEGFEEDIKTRPVCWGTMHELGSKVERFDGTAQSALKLLQQLVMPEDKRPWEIKRGRSGRGGGVSATRGLPAVGTGARDTVADTEGSQANSGVFVESTVASASAL